MKATDPVDFATTAVVLTCWREAALTIELASPIPRNAEPLNDITSTKATRCERIFFNDSSFPLAWNTSVVLFTYSLKFQGMRVSSYGPIAITEVSISGISRQIHTIYRAFCVHLEDKEQHYQTLIGHYLMGIRLSGCSGFRRVSKKVAKSGRSSWQTRATPTESAALCGHIWSRRRPEDAYPCSNLRISCD